VEVPPTTAELAQDLLMDHLGIDHKSSLHPNPAYDVIDQPVTEHPADYNKDRAQKKSNIFFGIPFSLLILSSHFLPSPFTSLTSSSKADDI
jgi:hypothetical protein